MALIGVRRAIPARTLPGVSRRLTQENGPFRFTADDVPSAEFQPCVDGKRSYASIEDDCFVNPGDDSSSKRQRIAAAGELCLLTLSFWATIWGTSFGGVALWNVAAGCVFFLIIGASVILRRPGWKASGFRIDNLRPALLRVGAITFCVIGLLILGFRIVGVPFYWPSTATLVDRLLFGISQQALLLGYLLPLWLVLLRRPLPAALANSIWFGLVHFPDGTLVLIAALSRFCFQWLFLRTRNVFAIGLAHGVLSFVALPLLLSIGAQGRIATM